MADAFYTGELEAELRLVGHVDYRFKKDSDRELCMEMIEEIRRTSTYPHPAMECAPDCKQRGTIIIYNNVQHMHARCYGMITIYIIIIIIIYIDLICRLWEFMDY